MPQDTLGAAKEFSTKLLTGEYTHLFGVVEQNLLRSLIERAFVEGASWSLDRVNEVTSK